MPTADVLATSLDHSCHKLRVITCNVYWSRPCYKAYGELKPSNKMHQPSRKKTTSNRDEESPTTWVDAPSTLSTENSF
ncbi:hypothetical protein RRG08_000834 [Elysia crispata]|uniref:Uncharacterized protein n=1 Tax=Elysia crispata TaxID=231223 RepID=A0AAE0XUM4_9GAST|nr:hypothetical protein RRG08_000834 [Elysia crispata]